MRHKFTHPKKTNVALKLQTALQYQQRGDLEKAEALYRQVLQAEPNQAYAWQLFGVICSQRGQQEQALDLINKAIAILSNDANFYSNRGLVLQELKRFDEALSDFDQAISLKPDFARAFYNRANVLKKFKRLNEALASYDQAIALKADYAKAFYNRATTLQELKRLDEALASYDQAIALKSDDVEALNNRGNALLELKRFDKALASYEQIISLKPDYAEAFYNRANALNELKRLDEALICYSQAIALKPDYADAFNNRGFILQDLKRFDEAIANYDQAIAIDPQQAVFRWNKSLILLLIGDFKQGWPLYEWRWKKDVELGVIQRRFTQSLWLGEQNINGKTVLLHAEQGLGDTIQFCRYAKLVKERGASVILEAPPPLMHVLNTLSGVDMLVEADGIEPPIHFDFHCPLMSLPLAFKTEVNSIPSPESYLFADPDKTNAWKQKLGEHSKLRVGVVWNGGFRPNQPEVWAVNERRNIALDIFAAGLNEVDACFYSLQKGDPAESEIRGKESQYWPRGNFINCANEIVDFSDTAALIKNMDLVISVDTSTAHLAAALGTPTWVLNRFDSCWRWLQDRDDSPWYASIKLYRQEADRQWQPVLQRVARDLARTPSPCAAD